MPDACHGLTVNRVRQDANLYHPLDVLVGNVREHDLGESLAPSSLDCSGRCVEQWDLCSRAVIERRQRRAEVGLHHQIAANVRRGGDDTMCITSTLRTVFSHAIRSAGGHQSIKPASATLRLFVPRSRKALGVRSYRPLPLDSAATFKLMKP